MAEDKAYSYKKFVKSFEAKELAKRPFAVRIADELTSFFGSILFLVSNIIFFIFWLMVNSGKIPGIPIFDPFPFPLMTTIVSLEAIILTLIVLMSQNRQSIISTLREEIDMQVNLIAEKEITKILRILVEIAKKQNINFSDEELQEMIQDIEISYIERRLTEQLYDKNSSIIKRIKDPIKKVASEVKTVMRSEIDP